MRIICGNHISSENTSRTLAYFACATHRIFFTMSQVQLKVCSADRTAAHCCSCIDRHRYAIADIKLYTSAYHHAMACSHVAEA